MATWLRRKARRGGRPHSDRAGQVRKPGDGGEHSSQADDPESHERPHCTRVSRVARGRCPAPVLPHDLWELAWPRSVDHTGPMRHAGLWWLLRVFLYYTAFQLLAPFAIMFGGRSGRLAEGVAFGLLAGSIHPFVRRYLSHRRREAS